MIGIILGIASLAGGGGIAALIARFGLKVVLGNAGSLFKRVPRWVWIALAVAALLVAGYVYHQHRAGAAIAAAKAEQKKADDAAWQARFDEMHAQAVDIRTKAETIGRKISSTLKERHDAQIRDHDAVAGDMRLRGPGKAAAPANCRPVDYPGLSAAAGGVGGPGGGGAAAAGPLPSNERLALVPWSWLVDQARQADDSRSEVITWRNWYIDQVEAWEKVRGSTPAKPGALAAKPN